MKTISFKYLLLVAALLASSGIFISSCSEDDDGQPDAQNLPKMTFQDYTLEEADIDQTVTINLSLEGVASANGVVSFLVAGGTAEAGIDYEIKTNSPLVFTEGETAKSITLLFKGDEIIETKETIELSFFNPKNISVPVQKLIITLKDDDDNAAGLTIPSGGYTTPTEYPGMTLEWADEFNGTTLNTNWWSFETGDGCPNNCGWGNNELQYYREDNTTLVDGNLVITAKKQSFANRDYTSSRLVTKGKKVFKYGRIDIRAALPKGKGIWPALWMLGSNIDVVGWPACGEIDIMELTGDLPNRVLGTVHFGNNVANHQYKGTSYYLPGNKNFQDEFHVFSINWQADKIEYLVDDVPFYTVTPATTGSAIYPFNKNFFFIFNIAVGGNLPGNPDGSTPMPQRMIVDYVRVFK